MTGIYRGDGVSGTGQVVEDMIANKVNRTGDTMTAPLNVPAGATGTQVPQRGEIDTALALKANSSDVTSSLALKANAANAALTGTSTIAKAVIGDTGTEGSGINISGITYESTCKVSDIDGTNYAQTILHRHSTTLEPLILGARSNSNTTSHADVTAGQGLFSVFAAGWAGSNYKLFGQESFKVGTGTISNTSAPGKWSLSVTPNGAVLPVETHYVDSDGLLHGNVAPATTGTMAPQANQIIGRNLIVNGSCQVDQVNSGAAQTITAAAALAYTVDQWYAYCTGANVTGQQIAGSSSTNYGYQFTGAASVTGINFATRLEKMNTYHLAGTTASFQVTLSNSLLTSVTWTAYYANTADTFGTIASPTVTQIATGTFTVNATDTNYQVQIAIPAAATTGIQIVLSVGAQTSGTWKIQNAQLEKGSFCTTFERKLYDQVLIECQRYYEQNSNYCLWSGDTSSGSVYYVHISFKVNKRSMPTIVGIDVGSAGFAAGAPSLSATVDTIQANKTANAAVNGGYFQFGWTASARL